MHRPLVPLLILLILSPVGRGDEAPLVVRTVRTDGKPVANAKVWVFESVEPGKEPPESKPAVTNADGKASISVDFDTKGPAKQLFARDDAGRMGFTYSWEIERSGSELKLVLVESAVRAGRVTDPAGKPVAGAVVTPGSFYLADEKLRMSGGLPSSITVPHWEQKRLAVKTDADGRFKLTVPASGYSVTYQVEADGHGKRRWFASAGTELETKLFVPGSVSVIVAGVEPAKAKGADIYLSPQRDPAAKVTAGPMYDFRGTFDAKGRTTVEGVVPGKYTVTLQSAGTVPGLFEPGQPIEVVAGKTVEAVAKFGLAATVSGKITDPDGKGLAGAPIYIGVRDGQSQQPRQTLFAQTDQDGTFVAYGSAGWYSFYAQAAPDGYALPSNTTGRSAWPEPVKIEVGKAHEFAAFPLIKAVSFVGRVVDAKGQPVTGATISVADFHGSSRQGRINSDKDGRFTLKNLPPDDAVSPRVRLGKAVNVPETFELSAKAEPRTIEVSEANAATLKGRVTDTAGKPISGAKVHLTHGIQGVGRYAQYSTHRRTDTATTDADGRYTFPGLWPKDRYGVQVSATGYTDGEAKDQFGVAGQVKEFPVIKLARGNLSVSGVVVGPDGRTVPDAEVFQVDGPTRGEAKSAADGSFTLSGFPDTAGFVFVRKAGFRLAAAPVFPGKPDRVVVKLSALDGLPPAAPEISAAHASALNDLARHLFTTLWETREALGYGQSAITGMAELNPAEAKRWRDAEKERTAGKTDYTKVIDAVGRQERLLELARTDIDAAVAMLNGLTANAGYGEALRVCEKLLDVDKAKALRFAEVAVVKARQFALPTKIYSLAQAGDLMARAGGANGKAVIAEAVELAANLTPDENGRNSMTIGMVAARLAPHDGTKAESLLKSLPAGDYNRFLCATVARLALDDLDRAKGLLDKFKQDGGSYPRIARVRIAVGIAKQKPDAAVELVNGITDAPDRVQGLVRLAEVFAETDKPRAVKMIDAAFDLMERDAEGFRSWSNYAGRAGFAVVVAALAKQIGHPDLTTLVARALAMRGAGREESPDRLNDQRVNLATGLALVDPAAARHLLAAVAPPDEFVTLALSNRRDWTFALALADPERAKTVVDKRIEKAKAGGRNVLSFGGLSELGRILTAQNRLDELATWGSLPMMRKDFE